MHWKILIAGLMISAGFYVSSGNPLNEVNRVRALVRASRQPMNPTSITRIRTLTAEIAESGLILPDPIHSMALDPDGNLWMASQSGTPYYYKTGTNELEPILRPDALYGLLPDPKGMWLLTSRGAILHEGLLERTHIRFPDGVVPLCGARLDNEIFFGTTRGLFRGNQPEALHGTRVYRIVRTGNDLLIASDTGAYRYHEKRFDPLPLNSKDLLALLPEAGDVLAADADGFMAQQGNHWEKIRFAVPNLNLVSQNSSCVYRGIPSFGTLDGSIVLRQGGQWYRIRLSQWPVTALTANRRSIFAWTNNRLLKITLQ